MEIGGAGVVDGKAAGGGGGHGIVDGFEPVHAGSPEREHAADGEQHVDRPYPLGIGAETGVHLRTDGSGGFGGEHFDVSAHEGREHGNGEEHDSQSAYPLHERAPEQNAVGQSLDIIDDGGTGGGEAGHGLEVSIGKVGDAAMDKEGEHAEEREDDPGGSDYHVGIAAAEGVLGVATHEQE